MQSSSYRFYFEWSHRHHGIAVKERKQQKTQDKLKVQRNSEKEKFPKFLCKHF